jgi:hypothetical protein
MYLAPLPTFERQAEDGRGRQNLCPPLPAKSTVRTALFRSFQLLRGEVHRVHFCSRSRQNVQSRAIFDPAKPSKKWKRGHDPVGRSECAKLRWSWGQPRSSLALTLILRCRTSRRGPHLELPSSNALGNRWWIELGAVVAAHRVLNHTEVLHHFF